MSALKKAMKLATMSLEPKPRKLKMEIAPASLQIAEGTILGNWKTLGPVYHYIDTQGKKAQKVYCQCQCEYKTEKWKLVYQIKNRQFSRCSKCAKKPLTVIPKAES